MHNGPGFTSKAMFVWSQRTGVELRFIQPGKPTQNAFVESFNGKFRDACLNSHGFVDITDARRSIETWRTHFRNVSAVQPIFDAIDAIAAHCDAYSRWFSNTIRTARSRTSGEYLLGLPMVTPILSRKGASGKPRAVHKKECHLPIAEGLFEREAMVNCGRSMLRRFQREGEELSDDIFADRLLLTWRPTRRGHICGPFLFLR